MTAAETMQRSELVPRATIHQMEALRTQALDALAESWDAETRAFQALASAAPSTPIRLGRSDDRRFKDRDAWLADRQKLVDQTIWRHLLRASGLETLMDRTALEQFESELEKNPPPATADNCLATMEALLGDADLIFKRGIATAFSRLDRRFRSHDGFKIGSRVVLSGAFSDFGGWNYYAKHDATLRDIERTFLTLDSKPHPERQAGIVGIIDEAKRQGGVSLRAFTCEDDYFQVRGFKNGNAHLWFKRDDLLERVNLLLADYYGASLGAGTDVADKAHAPRPGAVAKNFGLFESPPSVVERLIEYARIAPLRPGDVRLRVLEPSCGPGAIVRHVLGLGHAVTAVEIQPHLVAQAPSMCVQGDFLAMTTGGLGKFDRVVMNPPFDRGLDVDHVSHALAFLKPGGRLVSVMAAGVEFREDRRTADFRARIERLGGRFHDLPAGSFAESGTNVNTVIVEVQAPKEAA